MSEPRVVRLCFDSFGDAIDVSTLGSEDELEVIEFIEKSAYDKLKRALKEIVNLDVYENGTLEAVDTAREALGMEPR